MGRDASSSPFFYSFIYSPLIQYKQVFASHFNIIWIQSDRHTKKCTKEEEEDDDEEKTTIHSTNSNTMPITHVYKAHKAYTFTSLSSNAAARDDGSWSQNVVPTMSVCPDYYFSMWRSLWAHSMFCVCVFAALCAIVRTKNNYLADGVWLESTTETYIIHNTFGDPFGGG